MHILNIYDKFLKETIKIILIITNGSKNLKFSILSDIDSSNEDNFNSNFKGIMCGKFFNRKKN
jgi:hypothetical protein